MSHITIKIVDDKGVLVPDSDRIITVEVLGSGILKGVDNGDLRREGSFSGNKIKTYSGKALAIVQSLRSKGDIHLVATCDGLPESVLIIAGK